MSVDVIIAYAVGERSQEDGWKKLCVLMHNITEPLAVLKNMEDEYKEKFAAPLPAAYRSAKSTALKAHNNGVLLLDANGVPKGKTAVAKECSEKVVKVVKSTDIGALVDQINAALEGMDGPTQDAFLNYIRLNLKGL